MQFQNPDELVDIGPCDDDEPMSETSALIGFVAGQTPGCSYGFVAEDPLYEKAIAECCIIKESSSFSEGILLKCIDKQRKPLVTFIPYSCTDMKSSDCILLEV
ncbi:unnamed protein product [Nippostrongylus brasiliensis]|uniref:PrcB_C domain-containing protein n=1 Tax=Nippostrongylus brasiliensis TaxID=27835 RepID=A0A0N4YGI7_NIPBR|nr:unnamed protein product [Nippostrongylus brasiliensis]